MTSAKGKRRILVTGATGFVGPYVASALLDRFCGAAEIHGVGRCNRSAALPETVFYTAADLSDSATVSKILRDIQPTDIVHLAAVSSVSDSASKPIRSWSGNVVNLLTLAAAIVEHLPSANIFFASSGEVYGRSFLRGQPLNESALPLPVGTYATTKYVGEQILTDVLAKVPGLRLVVLRPFNHIGPRQDERFVVASFAAQIARIEAKLVAPILEVGDLSARRDFLDVRDVAEAYASLIEGADNLERNCIYNICSGQARSIESVLASLTSLTRTPFEIKVASDRLRPSEIAVACGDASALKSMTGWEPRRDLYDTLALILDHERAKVASFDIPSE